MTDKPAPTTALALPTKQLPVVVEPKPIAPIRDPYEGAATAPFDERAQAVLSNGIDPALVEIKPHNGVVFISGNNCRRVLNEAFGRGGWTMIPHGETVIEETTNEWGKKALKMYQKWELRVMGRYVDSAMGAQEYIASNPDMDRADAYEGTKTNAVSRCCKALGVAEEMWDKTWREKWKAEYCVQVHIKGKPKTYWRRKVDPPLQDETGIATSESKPEPTVGAPRPAPKRVIEAPLASREETNMAPTLDPLDPLDDDQPPFAAMSDQPEADSPPPVAPPPKPVGAPAKKASTPAPAKPPAEGEERGESTGNVELYSHPKQDKNGKTIYGLKINGEWWNTYSADIFESGVGAKRAGRSVAYGWTKRGTWRELDNLFQI